MNNKQVSHLWANQSKSSAHGSSFYFEGATIYSYGAHFPIARHHKGAVLFTTRSYSVTTSKHISITHGACHHLPVFHVDNVMQDPSRTDVASYGKRVKAATLELARARSGHQWKLDTLTRIITEANDFCARFKFKTRFSLPTEAEIAEVKRKAAEETSKKAAQTAERNASIARENEAAISEWLAGSRSSLPRTVAGTYLRSKNYPTPPAHWSPRPDVEGSVMETSKGAHVPIADAERAFRFVTSKRATGWHRNGETFKVGDFHLDAVNEQGVVAGCHRIAWPEIERFANSQGWKA